MRMLDRALVSTEKIFDIQSVLSMGCRLQHSFGMDFAQLTLQTKILNSKKVPMWMLTAPPSGHRPRIRTMAGVIDVTPCNLQGARYARKFVAE